MKKTILRGAAIAAIGSMGLTVAHAQTQPAKPQKPSNHSYTVYSSRSFLNAEEDSSMNPPQTVITYKNDALYHIRMVDDKVIDLSIDGRKIPADSFYVYENLTRKLATQIKADKAQAKLDKEQAEKDQLQARRDQEQAEKDEIQAKKDQMQADEDRQQAKRDAEQAERDKLEAEKDHEGAMEAKQQAEQDRQQADRDRAQADRDRAQADRDREQSERDRKQAVEDRIQAAKDRKQAAEDRAMTERLINEVIKEGLVPDRKSLRSLTLDEDGFIINGRQQSEELHKKFREKFLPKAKSVISFRNDPDPASR